MGAGEHVLYSLYGIVEHSGSMRGGHYAAYVKIRSSQRRASQSGEVFEPGFTNHYRISPGFPFEESSGLADQTFSL